MAGTDFSLSGKKVWVAGHRGMVGSAMVRRLASEDCEVLTVGRDSVDLRRQDAVERWMRDKRPDVVVIAAAKVGGILANSTLPSDFLYDNLVIETNIIHGAHLYGVSKLLFLGSSCIYPRLAAQPMAEDALLTGPLEPTNEWYAIAKIAGIKLCQAYRQQHGCDFISAMPTNLFGPGDNFDVQAGHVVAGLIIKAHQAKVNGSPSMELWGTGTPLREFLHVGDLADALVFLLKHYSDAPHINVGTGTEHTIRQLAETIGKVVGFTGEFRFDTSKPDGSPRKLMDNSRLHALGWRAHTSLEEGLREAYAWYLANHSHP
ncbi:bifunctional GDP-fucose synthetase: GDP-4-dehydro-6-deoxy-D-mannose epimerase and GDP-4-dehydro-6-L-deoxygalactose reductase [Candidatus Terasakiella magnetica]|nr:bifunctional GDP-fucose synthetase: GDP-4-dehydro-6-deoxy-D-mannose epimerase and GDP-4-dehydro-6-L-deoxygalactose reductase [Candidatus Terasakiella magnetica]